MSFADMFSKMKQRRAPAAPAYGAAPVNWNDPSSIIAGQGATAGAAGTYGAGATADYAKRLTDFDPTAAINKYAQGTWGAMKTGPGGLDESLASLKGKSVGAGRLDTGFFDQDTGDLYRSTVNDFGNAMAKTSVEGARMGMANTEALGQFGADQTDLNLKLGSGRAEQLINDAREKAERARKRKRGIGGLIGAGVGGVGGFMLGGPAGAMKGAELGYSAGSGM